MVTIDGINFGSTRDYTTTTQGGAVSTVKVGPGAALRLRTDVICSETTLVSDNRITCKVAPLPLQAQPQMDTSRRRVVAKVFVDAIGSKSTQDVSFHYTDGGKRGGCPHRAVPIYFACSNDNSDAASKSVCFSCCRSNCAQDEFNQGGKRGGFTYAYCDATCYKYCGYVSRRRLLRRRAIRRM